MSPQRLALRTLLMGSTRNILAVVLIAGSLCVLDLYAGHVASGRARMEYQAVVADRLGHLSIQPVAEGGQPEGARMFEPEQAQRVMRLLEASAGVALAVPQMRVAGIASTGTRSTLFAGEGILPVPPKAGLLKPAPGKLEPATPQGIALRQHQARALGLASGGNLTLTGASLDTQAKPLDATVVDIYEAASDGDTGRSPLLMPFSLAQSLLDTERTERVVVYLAEPVRMEESRAALTAALRAVGIPVLVKTWLEQSPALASERAAADIAFDSIAGMVFAVIGATVAATLSMNALERRREVATLRALGMRSSAVFTMFVTEALWMALTGVLVSLVASALVAWIINRAALSYTTQQALGGAPMLLELDFSRMGMAVLTVLAVAILAALVPAFKAARGPIAPALAA